MAVDVTLRNSNSLTNIQTNMERIQTALQDSVSRSGNTPNSMSADLDLNSNDLINVGIIDAEDIVIDGVDLSDRLDEVVAARDVAVNASIVSVNASNVATNAANVATTKAAEAAISAQEALENSIGLSISTRAEAEAGLLNTKAMTPLRSFQSISSFTGFVTLEMYGGKGDNTTDDSAAFAAAAATGKSILLGPKTYYIPTIHSYTMPTSLVIQGRDRAVSRLRSGMAWPVVTPNLDQNCFNIGSTTKVIARDVAFLNFGIVFRIPNVTNDLVFNYDRFDIEGCEFVNCYMVLSSLHYYYNVYCREFRFMANHIHDCQSSIFFFSILKSSMVLFNIFEDLNRTHRASDSTHHTCQAVNFLYTSNPDTELLTGDHHFCNNVVRRLNSTLVGDTASGHGDVNAFTGSGLRVIATNNTIDTLTSAQGINTEGLYTKANYVVMSDNSLTDAGSEQAALNIKFSPTNALGAQAIISNNVINFSDAYNASISSSGSTGIRVEGRDVQILGNRITGTTAIGINITNPQTALNVADNIVTINSGHGIIVFDSCLVLNINDNVVLGKSCTGTASYLLRIYSTSDLLTAELADLSIKNNKLKFDAASTVTDARCIFIVRNAGYSQIDIDGNVCNILGSATTKRMISVTANNVGTNSGTIALLNIHDNSFLPFGLPLSNILGLTLANMDGLLRIKDNVGFRTEETITATIPSGTSVNATHTMSSWTNINIAPSTAAPAAPPISGINVSPQTSLGTAAYVYCDSSASTTVAIKLNASAGVSTSHTVRLSRNELQIAA